MSLAGTKWVISHPNSNGITFNNDGSCVYGGYTGTFTENGQIFQAKVNCMPGDPNYLYTEFDGSHNQGKGNGTMKNVWRSGFNPPPGQGPRPFTMTKVP